MAALFPLAMAFPIRTNELVASLIGVPLTMRLASPVPVPFLENVLAPVNVCVVALR